MCRTVSFPLNKAALKVWPRWHLTPDGNQHQALWGAVAPPAPSQAFVTVAAVTHRL